MPVLPSWGLYCGQALWHASDGRCQPHHAVGPVEDAVVAAQEDVPKDPELAAGRGQGVAFEAAHAGAVLLLVGTG